MAYFNYSKIKEFRIKNKLTQKDLSQSLGISNRAVSKWENGLSFPSSQHIFELSKIFGVPMDIFYSKNSSNIQKPKITGMSSITELYKIGRGPSSSHTIGPEKACKEFLKEYKEADFFKAVLCGSLAKTGKGHGTDTVIKKTFSPYKCQIEFDFNKTDLPHPNTMYLLAFKGKTQIAEKQVQSVGGGSIVWQDEKATPEKIIYPHTTFSDIAKYCTQHNIRIWEYALKYEDNNFKNFMQKIWTQMKDTIHKGLESEGILPGGLELQRKAKTLYESQHIDETAQTRENRMVCSFAFATSEQNASGETIVTAPTCGAAGVLPAVLYYYQKKNGFTDSEIVNALITAGIIGNLIKTNASISGAECGCQAEIGSACAMAAAALAELLDLNFDKIEYAAEIAIEHHLGLTCDPICGLVQIPCIERNAVAAMRAINAVNLSSFLWSTRKISLDSVIKTMKETGHDLSSPYKETSEAGLAKIKL
ncbi:MAG: L-serine ammonia-lyase [Ruminococcaceae bacterium]|nr:L-serine ammonia-lyase [Oscillospiraceae bacterium]